MAGLTYLACSPGSKLRTATDGPIATFNWRHVENGRYTRSRSSHAKALAKMT